MVSKFYKSIVTTVKEFTIVMYNNHGHFLFIFVISILILNKYRP